ncbi:MAG: hypothetical protein ABIG20_01105 [archaeon]
MEKILMFSIEGVSKKKLEERLNLRRYHFRIMKEISMDEGDPDCFMIDIYCDGAELEREIKGTLAKLKAVFLGSRI